MDFAPEKPLQYYPFKPPQFIRITDDRSYVQYGRAGPCVAFDVGYSTRCIAFNHRVTPSSVRSHLEWSPSVEWKGLISVCGTADKARREIQWRRKLDRQNICGYRISTEELRWRTIRWNDMVTIDALIDGSEQIVFFRATELIQKLGLAGRLKAGVQAAAADEWLALEWIPAHMVVQINL